MNINKLSNLNNKDVNKTNGANEGAASQKTSKKSSTNSPADKVSLNDYPFRNNDQLFAKLELEKLNDSSSQRLQEIKVQVKEFQQASEVSPEAADQTEMGQKINAPSTWSDIAHKILQ